METRSRGNSRDAPGAKDGRPDSPPRYSRPRVSAQPSPSEGGPWTPGSSRSGGLLPRSRSLRSSNLGGLLAPLSSPREYQNPAAPGNASAPAQSLQRRGSGASRKKNPAARRPVRGSPGAPATLAKRRGAPGPGPTAPPPGGTLPTGPHRHCPRPRGVVHARLAAKGPVPRTAGWVRWRRPAAAGSRQRASEGLAPGCPWQGASAGAKGRTQTCSFTKANEARAVPHGWLQQSLPQPPLTLCPAGLPRAGLRSDLHYILTLPPAWPEDNLPRFSNVSREGP